jgi:hypothetical protein
MGLTRLLNELSEDEQRAWEGDFARALERTRTGGLIRLGGVTRIVRARPLPAVRTGAAAEGAPPAGSFTSSGGSRS